METGSPPLPPRGQHNEIVLDTTLSQDPSVGAQASNLQHFKFKANDSLSCISLMRQAELCRSTLMNNCYNILSIEARHSNLSEDGTFWGKFINDYSDETIRNGDIAALEEEILAGIPAAAAGNNGDGGDNNLRAAVYEKVLDIKYNFSTIRDLQRYVKEGPGSSGEDQVNQLELLIKESGGAEFNSTLRFFLMSVYELISSFPQPQKFFVLLKMYQWYILLRQDEFVYKVNRGLEDSLGESFPHFSSQGINWSAYYKEMVPVLMVSPLILDLVVFEGADFILRLIVWLFTKSQDKLLKLHGDDMLDYVRTDEFFGAMNGNLSEILELDLPVVLYENEFYLMSANSLSNNRNELSNLKDIRDELTVKISETKRKIDELQLTHTEIAGQSTQFTSDLESARQENLRLNEEKTSLQKRYENLTMKENLANTIQANKEFFQRNEDLKLQVEKLRKSVEQKKVKLAKVGV
ncbi:uncharacterized protein LODBEIA_P21390 [Lodderomyces beijingensis]|uniref:Rab-GAP TBC domain-containing protein n=1 Tax=Lodderomyces beijingensis TaxID=1775926 RepID=A0ABP0ZID5_9ASCO